MNSVDLLREWLSSNQGKYVDVIIAGRVIGGRLQESPQTPRELVVGDDSFTLRFATTEILVVRNPSGFVLGEYGQLIVPDADEARFGWHYYGRPQVPENWCQEIYRRRGKKVELVREGSLHPGEEGFQYSGEKFVELL